MSQDPFILKWGLLGPGRIATKFFSDLLYINDPLRSSINNGLLKHELVAVASNSNVKNADNFVENLTKDHHDDSNSIKTYGKYIDLINDEKIDIIYIATPNFNHFKLCYNCLKNGKNVLMEKPFTINSKQTEILIEFAKSQKLFLMEAMWTKFNPVFKELKNLIFNENILLLNDESKDNNDKLLRIKADTSYLFDKNDPSMDRIYNLKLGGGVLLDVGIYSLTWLIEFMNNNDSVKILEPLPKISSLSVKDESSGVDISTNFILNYSNKDTRIVGIGSCSGYFDNITETDDYNTVIIEGESAVIKINDSCCPRNYRIEYRDSSKETVIKSIQFKGFGMYFEADSIGEEIMKGNLQSSIHSLNDTLILARIIDEIRLQNEIEFPKELESLDL
ncbi:unnamed protein product [[Candida] boidinii]|uniref:Unnamed protein product n=1 Tax=Candida boidinii TaxID=5477 RepID=A0ACB5TWL4_CANBO|nr:unnamed protein product [[Candida] boidinii]